MTATITRTYDNFDDARTVVMELKSSGVAEEDISVFAHDSQPGVAGGGSGTATGMSDSATMGDRSGLNARDPDGDGNAVANGAGVGGVVGGAAGLLAGLGLMAIPGVGPLVAAGWLATTAAGAATGAVAGAATGGLVSALTDSGVEERDAHTYAEAVRRGAILVSVRARGDGEAKVRAVMDGHNPSDLDSRRSGWEQEGWTSYDPAAAPYSQDQRQRETQRWS
jgi:hypothetical protein